MGSAATVKSTSTTVESTPAAMESATTASSGCRVGGAGQNGRQGDRGKDPEFRRLEF
jgi:hypothetical protein